MKTKAFMIAAVAIATLFTAKADNDKPITFDKLPANSQNFIRQYFNERDISYAKVDNELFDRSYEVFFVNGSKVEFDKKGEWEVVDCLSERVPSGVVPDQLEAFVEKRHPGLAIVKIDKDKRDYEIELSNGLEIKFDLKFNLIGYDD